MDTKSLQPDEIASRAGHGPRRKLDTPSAYQKKFCHPGGGNAFVCFDATENHY